MILIYACDAVIRKTLRSRFEELGLDAEVCADLPGLAGRAAERKPAVAALYLGAGEDSAAAVSALRRASPESEIVLATQAPGSRDLEAIQHGVFYYAGDGGTETLVQAAQAALKGMGGGETRLVRYQLRLRPGETLADVMRELVEAIGASLARRPGWGSFTPEDGRALERELCRCLDFYVSGYDLCGLKAGCFEAASPLPWGPPDPLLSEPRDWEGVRVLQVEVREHIDEFLRAIEAAVFRALCKDVRRAALAREALTGLEAELKTLLAPRLFRAGELECDLCLVVNPIDPWTLQEQAR